MAFEIWFPTVISYDVVPNADELNQRLIKVIREIHATAPAGGESWIGKIYNTLGTHNLVEDERFREIVDYVEDQCRKFAEFLNYDIDLESLKCREAWINVYHKQGWQEYHTHANHLFSGVYYVQMPVGASRIVFESPLEPDMLAPRLREVNNYNAKTCSYLPVEGQLILFRSYLRHAVHPHESDVERISLAFNLR